MFQFPITRRIEWVEIQNRYLNIDSVVCYIKFNADHKISMAEDSGNADTPIK